MKNNTLSGKKDKVLVIIPNWNGAALLPSCLDSLKTQSFQPDILVVDNGSKDNSLEIIKKYTDKYIVHKQNLGFTGGVNAGLEYALEHKYTYAILFNNDAVAQKEMVSSLIVQANNDQAIGIVTSKILDANGVTIDSTGDFMSTWGLVFPRGRGEVDTGQYDDQTEIFAASGGASCYRVAMLKEVGLFDDDFFAYYEDVDISYRAQLAGWKVSYSPKAVVHHKINTTSNKIKGLAVQMSIKNMPWLVIKNTPSKLLAGTLSRFWFAYSLMLAKAVLRGDGVFMIKGLSKMIILLPKKLSQRRNIQKTATVSADYISEMLYGDLPPSAHALRKLRKTLLFWKTT